MRATVLQTDTDTAFSHFFKRLANSARSENASSSVIKPITHALKGQRLTIKDGCLENINKNIAEVALARVFNENVELIKLLIERGHLDHDEIAPLLDFGQCTEKRVAVLSEAVNAVVGDLASKGNQLFAEITLTFKKFGLPRHICNSLTEHPLLDFEVVHNNADSYSYSSDFDKANISFQGSNVMHGLLLPVQELLESIPKNQKNNAETALHTLHFMIERLYGTITLLDCAEMFSMGEVVYIDTYTPEQIAAFRNIADNDGLYFEYENDARTVLTVLLEEEQSILLDYLNMNDSLGIFNSDSASKDEILQQIEKNNDWLGVIETLKGLCITSVAVLDYKPSGKVFLTKKKEVDYKKTIAALQQTFPVLAAYARLFEHYQKKIKPTFKEESWLISEDYYAGFGTVIIPCSEEVFNDSIAYQIVDSLYQNVMYVGEDSNEFRLDTKNTAPFIDSERVWNFALTALFDLCIEEIRKNHV